jgi:hypothetical protein
MQNVTHCGDIFISEFNIIVRWFLYLVMSYLFHGLNRIYLSITFNEIGLLLIKKKYLSSSNKNSSAMIIYYSRRMINWVSFWGIMLFYRDLYQMCLCVWLGEAVHVFMLTFNVDR